MVWIFFFIPLFKSHHDHPIQENKNKISFFKLISILFLHHITRRMIRTVPLIGI